MRRQHPLQLPFAQPHLPRKRTERDRAVAVQERFLDFQEHIARAAARARLGAVGTHLFRARRSDEHERKTPAHRVRVPEPPLRKLPRRTVRRGKEVVVRPSRKKRVRKERLCRRPERRFPSERRVNAQFPHGIARIGALLMRRAAHSEEHIARAQFHRPLACAHLPAAR